MCNHEQDFVIAKALKTLNENTESENLVPATNQSISKAAAKYELQVLGALAIAQVWIQSPCNPLHRTHNGHRLSATSQSLRIFISSKHVRL